MGLCCCLQLQKGVVTIGVLSLLSSLIFVVMNLVTCVTFEEHVTACRNNVARDVLKAFPECQVLTDASLLMAGRIFIYIQLMVWVTEIIASVLLVVAALKKRANLMIPWVTVSILVILVLAWNVYEAALGSNLLHLLLLIVTMLVSLYFVAVVRSFRVQVTKSSRIPPSPHEGHHMCHRSSSSSTLQTLPTCFQYSKAIPDIKMDLPPAYTPFATNKKGPLPFSLGMRSYKF